MLTLITTLVGFSQFLRLTVRRQYYSYICKMRKLVHTTTCFGLERILQISLHSDEIVFDRHEIGGAFVSAMIGIVSNELPGLMSDEVMLVNPDIEPRSTY